MNKWLITCEHGGNVIAPLYSKLFRKTGADLLSHKGWDIGALELFRNWVPLADAYYFSVHSRLLIELNRSLHHPNLYSKYSKHINQQQKQRIQQSCYARYRNLVEEKISEWLGQGFTIKHISVHSFTPALNGELRNADIGLLYDPARSQEKIFARKWKQEIFKNNEQLNVRFNYPYLGKADGFTTYLRNKYGTNYVGLEFELNQKLAYQTVINKQLTSSLKQLIGYYNSSCSDKAT